jgi:hypothetical protein
VNGNQLLQRVELFVHLIPDEEKEDEGYHDKLLQGQGEPEHGKVLWVFVKKEIPHQRHQSQSSNCCFELGI